MGIVATRITRITRSTLVVVIATATLAALGLSATFGGGDSAETRTPAPDWFRPIAEYYDMNPKITPKTDFAKLYFGDARS